MSAEEAAVPLLPGLTGRAELRVGERDTSVAMRSGDVMVLATPRIVALVEEAAVAAVTGRLPAGRTSVGTAVELDHLAPSRIGALVVADATLEEVEGRTLVFTVTVHEGEREVARGRHRRVVVDRRRFAGG